jgi:hypothetical protein
MRVLKNVEGIGICQLTDADVVRHVMVQRIVRAYEEYETAKAGKGKEISSMRNGTISPSPPTCPARPTPRPTAP